MNDFLNCIYSHLWGSWLHALYFKGPSLHTYGFWAGKEPEDICAEMTSVPAEHWHTEPIVCQNVLDKHFRAFEIGVNMLIYVSVGLGAVFMVMCNCIIVRPFSRVFRPTIYTGARQEHS